MSGRVQGVFFRHSTCEQAREIGDLLGFVRNLRDGRVEVVAEGPPGALERLHAYLLEGPPGASVTRVEEVSTGEPGDLEPFHVRK